MDFQREGQALLKKSVIKLNKYLEEKQKENFKKFGKKVEGLNRESEQYFSIYYKWLKNNRKMTKRIQFLNIVETRL